MSLGLCLLVAQEIGDLLGEDLLLFDVADVRGV
jgi:hypothetical protein